MFLSIYYFFLIRHMPCFVHFLCVNFNNIWRKVKVTSPLRGLILQVLFLQRHLSTHLHNFHPDNYPSESYPEMSSNFFLGLILGRFREVLYSNFTAFLIHHPSKHVQPIEVS